MELGDCGSSKQRLRVEARRVDEVFFGGGPQSGKYMYVQKYTYECIYNSMDTVLKV